MSNDKQFDKEDLLQRLFAAMGCDDLEMAVLQAELDARESLKAAEAIRQCAGLPENVWPSPHERRFFIALKEHLSATLPSEPTIELIEAMVRPLELTHPGHAAMMQDIAHIVYANLREALKLGYLPRLYSKGVPPGWDKPQYVEKKS